jgi:hypothetical protein
MLSMQLQLIKSEETTVGQYPITSTNLYVLYRKTLNIYKSKDINRRYLDFVTIYTTWQLMIEEDIPSRCYYTY